MEILLDTLKWSVIVGVLALLLTLLRPTFEKRYSARWRYWLWLVLAALALLAPAQWETLVPAVPTVSTPVVIDVPELELQVVQGDRVSVSLRPAVAAPESFPPETQRAFRLDEVLPAAWLAGAAVFALYTLAGTWLFRHKARRWSRKPKEETVQVYESIRQDMGLKRAPLLRVSTAVGSPMLTGIFRPCLLLPGENWSERELSFILRHELTHYRRHDLWYKSVLLAANAVHWFNPLVYLLVKEANADMELTCDDEVVSGASQENRRAYSETLLAAVRRDKGIGTALSTHFYGGKEVMKERFRNILGKKSRKWGALALALTLLATAASACAFGLQRADSGTISWDASLDEGEPVLDAVHTYARDYIDGQIAQLAQSGFIVMDQREELTLVDTYTWDFYDSDIEVWKLEYALNLEHPENYIPAGSASLDGDGWLSGIDSQGEPHFIVSVYRGETPYGYELLETAYSNVEWEYGYTWEEYACCHALFGLDLSLILNGWPEASTEFLTSMRDGHETWALDWDDAALSYLAIQGEDPSLEGLSTLCVWKFDEDFSHDEGRLITFHTASGRTGAMLLTHIVYPVESWSTTLNFWQVAGIRWDDEGAGSGPDPAQTPSPSGGTDYQELFDESLNTDGAFSELSAIALAEAFDAGPQTFVSELSQRPEDEIDRIAGLLVYGEPGILAVNDAGHTIFYEQTMLWLDKTPAEQAVIDAIQLNLEQAVY